MLRRPEFQWSVLMAALGVAFALSWSPPKSLPPLAWEDVDGPVVIADMSQNGLAGLIQSSRKSPVVFRDSFTTSGPLIADTANTVAHVTWNGSALVDSKGNAWTMSGTVPQVAGTVGGTQTPMLNAGFTAAPRSYSGSYSSSNNYTALTSNPINFAAAPFSMCAVAIPTASVSFQTLLNFSNGNPSTGYLLATDSPGTGWQFYLPTASATIANSVVLNAVNVVCAGYDGAHIWLKVNLASIASTVAASYTQSGAGFPVIGYANTDGAFSGRFIEAWWSTDTPSDALFTSIEERVLNEIADTGQIVTDARARTATYNTNGARWIAPSNVARVEVFPDGGGGLLVEPEASTNYLLNSEAPATQTTASLGTGPYTGSTTGAGGVIFTTGTAVATGLPCTTTTFAGLGEGGDCHFTITVSGTIVATVSGAVNHEQLEGLAARSSDIITAGTSVTRAAETVSVTRPTAFDMTKPWCMGAALLPYDGNFALLGGSALGAGASHAGANTAEVNVNTSLADLGIIYDATPALRQASYTLPDSKRHTLLACASAGVITQWVDGALVTSSGSGAGTGIIGSNPSTIYFGAEAGGAALGQGVYLQNIVFCGSSNGGACR